MYEVCVPFRADGGHRDAAWRFLRERWLTAGFEVIVGDSDPSLPFSAARARNDAIERATGPVVLVCDADIRVPIRAAHEAIRAATDTGLYVVAHDRVCWLDEKHTGKVLAGKKPRLRWGNEEARHTWGACYALPVQLWWKAGGFDEGFRGWGAQDIAFWLACRTIAGAARIESPATAFHLYHPPRHTSRRENPFWRANQNLFRRYRDADEDESAMRDLIRQRTK